MMSAMQYSPTHLSMLFLCVAALTLGTACSEQKQAVVSCESMNGMQPVCGFTNPEDLAVVPGGEFLLVSEMGAFMSDAPNTLSLLNLASNERESIHFNWSPGAERWGDPACTPPTAELFSPHGIDLLTRADGRHQVLAINHGDEQVEFFELSNAAQGWQLDWKGCAKPPGDPFINDVAALNDGGFLATHMWNKTLPFEEVVAQLSAGESTGWVWEWQPESGFAKLPGSEDLMPNGIAVNPDNTKIFVNIYMGNRHIRIDRASGEVDAQFDVPSPDNVVMGPEGNIWIASHLNDPVEGRCEDGHTGPCLLPFQVVKANADTMQPHTVFTHDGEPMGYATVALPHNGRLYFGSASGDRVASVALHQLVE